MLSILHVRDMFTFLDQLREEGTCNMFGAFGPLQCAFGLDREEAKKVLKAWMTMYGKYKDDNLMRAREGFALIESKPKK